MMLGLGGSLRMKMMVLVIRNLFLGIHEFESLEHVLNKELKHWKPRAVGASSKTKKGLVSASSSRKEKEKAVEVEDYAMLEESEEELEDIDLEEW